MVPDIGQIEPFSSAVDSWLLYPEQLEQYFTANGIATEEIEPVL